MNLSRRFFVTFLCSFGRSSRLILAGAPRHFAV